MGDVLLAMDDARERRHPSRSQARQRAHSPRGRPPSSQDRRLRHREGARGHDVHRLRRPPGHVPVHVPGGEDAFARGSSIRHLFARRHALQARPGKAAVRRTHFSVMMAHVTNVPGRPKLRPDIPEALEKLILDALEGSDEASGLVRGVPRAPARRAAAARLQAHDGRHLPTSPPATLRRTGGREMVLVGAGSFAMGPSRREVHLDAFYMDRVPVTNAQFAVFPRRDQYKPTDAGAKRVPRPLAQRQTGARRRSGIRGLHLPGTTRAPMRSGPASVCHGRRVGEGGARHRRPPLSVNPHRPAPDPREFRPRRGARRPWAPIRRGASPYRILDLAGNVQGGARTSSTTTLRERPEHEPEARRAHAEQGRPRDAAAGSFGGTSALDTDHPHRLRPLVPVRRGGFRARRRLAEVATAADYEVSGRHGHSKWARGLVVAALALLVSCSETSEKEVGRDVATHVDAPVKARVDAPRSDHRDWRGCRSTGPSTPSCENFCVIARRRPSWSSNASSPSERDGVTARGRLRARRTAP